MCTPSSRRSLSYINQSIDLLRVADGFYMIGTSVMKELNADLVLSFKLMQGRGFLNHSHVFVDII